MAGRCYPPKSVSVREHWRVVKYKRKIKTPKTYYVAENERGERCGHEHRTFTAAATCARRTQRHYAKRYGRKSAGTFITGNRTR